MRIAYLDGLRGIAATTVLFSHLFLVFWPALHSGTPDAVKTGFEITVYNLPISALYNGSYAVAVFFVLSGYVLSCGYWATKNPRAIKRLALRRYPRLAIPAVASAVLVWAAASADLFQAPAVADLSSWIKAALPTDKPTLAEAIRQSAFTAFFVEWAPINPVLWTMLVETYGSVLVFALCLLSPHFGRGQPVVYIAIALGLCWALADIGAWLSLFLVGMCLAQYKPAPIPLWLGLVALFAAFNLASCGHPNWWHAWIGPLKFFKVSPLVLSVCLAATLTVWAVLSTASFKRALSAPVFRRLGALSFSLYLTHLVVLAVIAPPVFSALLPVVGYSLAAVVTLAVCVMMAFGAAAVFYAAVDGPAVAALDAALGLFSIANDHKPSATGAAGTCRRGATAAATRVDHPGGPSAAAATSAPNARPARSPAGAGE
jgi:peptidoglycan/LPS O-acetylase OafA/YrhL